MTENRAPSICWALRRFGKYPNGYVTTTQGDGIQIAYFCNMDHQGDAIVLSRKDARLLAKRINQCLDKTVKK